MVRADEVGLSVLGEHLLQVALHLAGTDGGSNPASDTDPGELVHDVEDPDGSPAPAPNRHEVVAPDVSRAGRRQGPQRGGRVTLGTTSRGLGTPGRHPVSLQSPQALDALAVDAPALGPKQAP